MLQTIAKIIAVLIFLASGFLLFTNGYFTNNNYDTNFDKQIQEQKALSTAIDKLNSEFIKNQNLIIEADLTITNQKSAIRKNQEKTVALQSKNLELTESEKLEISNSQKELESLDIELKKSDSELTALQNKKIELKNSLEKTQTSQKEVIQSLRNNLGIVAGQWLFYIFIIFGYFMLYRLAILIHFKYFAKIIARKKFKKILRTITTITIVFTVLYALSAYFATILTTFGFISAALVFSLQNYIASLFAFVLNNTVNPMYKVGDIVTVGPSFLEFTGKVNHVGLFFTQLEKLDKHTELEEGRIVFVPNVNMFKEPFTNITPRNFITWHIIKITLESAEQLELARETLEKLIHNFFHKAMAEAGFYLDYVDDLEQFKPKIYLELEPDGIVFIVHIATRFGSFSEIQTEIVESVIAEFTKQEITIKFKA